jgi:hypothetical protein
MIMKQISGPTDSKRATQTKTFRRFRRTCPQRTRHAVSCHLSINCSNQENVQRATTGSGGNVGSGFWIFVECKALEHGYHASPESGRCRRRSRRTLLCWEMPEVVGTFRRSLPCTSLTFRRHVVLTPRDVGRGRAEEDLRPQPACAGVHSSFQTLSRFVLVIDDNARGSKVL